jgi:hypothetical protein
VFNRIFAELAGEAGEPDTIMIDATHLKAHRTAASLLKGGSSRTYRAHQGRPELEAARRVRWRGPSARSAAQRGADERRQRGGALMIDALPCAHHMIGDRCYNADWF